MSKSVTVTTKLDTSDFDRKVQEMVNKLNSVTRPLNDLSTAKRVQQAGIGGMSPAAMETYQRATQSASREMDRLIAQSVKAQAQMSKELEKNASGIKQLQNEQKTLIKDSEKELEVRKKIGDLEKNQAEQRKNYRQRDAQINQALDAREKLQAQNQQDVAAREQMRLQNQQAIRDRNPEGWGRAGRFAKQGMYGAAGREGLNAVGGWGGIVGGVGAIAGGIGAAGMLGERFTGYGQRLQAAQGSAIEGTAGQNLRDVYSGRSPFESQWAQERDASAGLAKQKADRNRVTDQMKGWGSVGAIGAGIATGAASLAGVPFTMGGSAVGLGPSAAMIGGGIAGLSNDRTRKSLFGGAEYEKLLKADQAKDFRSSYEDLKNQDPGKKLALEDFEQNSLRNVRSQRQLGLSNNQFYKGGGFLSNIQQGGFMGEQGINMANQIIGAGGSARMGGQALHGLQMERAGLTNASGILGATSASIQNPEANKRATISIMSEAFKIGLDSTTFAEENRRFAQAAANIIGKSGVTSEADQDRLSAVLGQFMGQKTNAGVQEAQGAYEKYQERGSQTSGRRGTLRFAEAMKDQDLSKMNTSDLTELLSMRPEEMNASNPAMAEFARSAGISVDDLVKKMTGKGGVNEAGRFVFPGQKGKIGAASEKLNKYMKETGMSYSDLGDKSRIAGGLPPEIQQALGRTMIEANKSEAGGLTTGAGIAGAGEFVEGAVRPGDMKGRAAADLSKGQGRIEDLFIQKAAEGADEARKNFNQMTEAIWLAAAGAKAFTDSVAPMAGKFNVIADANRRSLPQGQGNNSDFINSFMPNYSLQTQGNKPKGN